MKKNIILLTCGIILSILTGVYFGQVYSMLFKQIGGGLFVMSKSATNQIVGFPLAVLFFVPLFLESFGSGNKKIWNGIIISIILAFWVYFDVYSIYFPIVVAAAGLFLGYILKIFMPKKSAVLNRQK